MADESVWRDVEDLAVWFDLEREYTKADTCREAARVGREQAAALTDLLDTYDPESGTLDASSQPSCPACTMGATPDSANRGPCAYHRAARAIAPRQRRR